MKNMIITLALVILISTLMAYQKDSATLVYTMNAIKNVCDEMTRSAALEIDQDSLEKGIFKFDKNKARNNAKKSFEEQMVAFEKRANRVLFPQNQISYIITFDEEKGRVKTVMDLGQADYGLRFLNNSHKLKVSSIYEYVLQK